MSEQNSEVSSIVSAPSSPFDTFEASVSAVLPESVKQSLTESVNADTGDVRFAETVSVESAPQPAASNEVAEVAEDGPNQQAEDSVGEIGFADLSLRGEVEQAVLKSGYEKPTAVQAQIIPYMLDGRDVLAQSQTGTGKTAAFALPILSRIESDREKPQVLVLAPTRELAIQVAKSFSTYAGSLPGFSVAAIYGGQDYSVQFKQLRRGVDVVVGTPGRVIDHIKRGTLDLSGIDCLVLDEADEMLNMGFLEDVQFVLDQTPDDRQIALFSATLPAPIRVISQRYLKDPARITIQKKTMTADCIRQRALFVAPFEKIDTLKRLLEVEETDGVIVFSNTKDSTVSIAEQLNGEGLSAIALNGDMPQKVRERTIEQLKSGQLNILVATDVAARGLDVTRVSHVFNFDVPQDTESYIHRIGRTGRAGRKGEAIVFLTNGQRGKLRYIERATKQPIEVVQPPTANDINAIRIKRFTQRITDMATDQDLTMFEDMISAFAEESEIPMVKIAAALAQIGQQGRPFLAMDRPRRKQNDRYNEGSGRSKSRVAGQRDSQRGKGQTDSRQVGPAQQGKVRYRVEVGRNDGVKPGNIVGAIANEGGIAGEHIGPIRIHDRFSTVDLPEGMPREVFQTLQNTRVTGKQLQLRVAGEDGEESGPVNGNEYQDKRTHRAKRFGGKGPARDNSFHAEKRRKQKTKTQRKDRQG